MREWMDLHVYTNNSPFGSDKVSYLCETAVARGLRAVAFTDVCGLDTMENLDTRRRMRHAFYDTAKARQLFFGSLSVFSGIELEQACMDPETASAMLRKREYDLVLSAVTRFENAAPFGLTRDTSPAEFAAFSARYAALLARTVEETDFDALSRLVAPLRETPAPTEAFEESVKPVLRALAAKDRALEVTTPDLLGSERVRDLYMRLIGFFREAGGKKLVIGSAAACCDQLGAGIELTAAALRRIGFSEVYFYDKRIPYAISL